jgi:hypothetical protein
MHNQLSVQVPQASFPTNAFGKKDIFDRELHELHEKNIQGSLSTDCADFRRLFCSLFQSLSTPFLISLIRVIGELRG